MTPAGLGAVLVAHGSADPRAAVTVRSLAQAVAAARPDVAVRVAYLGHTPPRPATALTALAAAGHRAAVVVPLLLTAAYHQGTDLPAALRQARRDGLTIPVRLAGVLGPTATSPVPPPLLSGLVRRLVEAGGRPGRFDAVVLVAAGTTDPVARAGVAMVAEQLAARLRVPGRAAYVTAATPTPGAAVAEFLAAGARAVAVAAYFLAPGRLYRAAVTAARRAGAAFVARPLGAAPEVVEVVSTRIGSVSPWFESVSVRIGAGPAGE